jgi:glucose-6-phosphate-specific signal transduction histidine kinase
LIKKVIFTILQFVLFLVAFAVGSFLLPLRNISYVTTWANGTRGFEWDGILLMLAFFVLVLLIEALRKRFRNAAPWTTLALVLAVVLGLVMKFGFKDLLQ